MNPLKLPEIIEKPWGREVIYAHTGTYAGKILEIKRGQRLSLQLHEVKEETLYLLSGHVKLTYGSKTAPTRETFDWTPGLALHIPPQTIHRFEAIEDSVILEVSTAHLSDVIRFEDDYGRTKHG